LFEDSWGVVCKSQLLNVSKLGQNGLLHILLLAMETLISVELLVVGKSVQSSSTKRQHVRAAAACYATTTRNFQYNNNT
jgi:hypothetical protein